LLDEPFGALDNQTRGLMQELLLGIWERERKTVLFVTHDIEEAVYLADRIVALGGSPGTLRVTQAIDVARPRRRGDPGLRAAAQALREDLAAGSAAL
jgi:ABC-type nitrate/sulfonate/bicarbonate transport system ATPase subunit